MLKQRIITALILAPLLLAAMLWLPPWPFALFTALVFGVAGWEWAGLAGLRGLGRLAYGLLITLLCLGCFFLPVPLQWWLLGFCSWVWLFCLWWLLDYPTSAERWGSRGRRSWIGVPMLLGAWLGVHLLLQQAQGLLWLLLLLLLVWGADIGAYFSGRRWGRRKLAPEVSPGKTWAGYYGGLASALLVGWLFIALLGTSLIERALGPFDWLGFGLLALVTATISVVGDLTESMFKRYRGVKDSSGLLPGHGGVLDRIDSLIAALPFYSFAVLLWSH